MASQIILFVCTHNSARSIMAEAILRTNYGKNYEVNSAGTLPSSVNPYTKQVLAELGINTDNLSSKSIEEFNNKKIDLLVTVCDSAKENCPFIPGAKRLLHKSFQDPSKLGGTDEEIMNGFRRVRDEIFNWIISEFNPKKLEKE
ncbi:MAG: arsenate reductase ArsC [Candidatus Hodarchaeales archaeon]|jgi:arsenate reductase